MPTLPGIDRLTLFGVVVTWPAGRPRFASVATEDAAGAIASAIALALVCERTRITPDDVRSILRLGECCFDTTFETADWWEADMRRRGALALNPKTDSPAMT